MRAWLVTALRRFLPLALACGAASALALLAGVAAVGPVYAAEAEVVVGDPTILLRLASPFAALPDPEQATRGIAEKLTSHDRFVAVVKGGGLVDQWDSTRTGPQRLVDRVREKVKGPMEEKDLLDALVEIVRKRTMVTVEGRRVRIWSEWPSRATAKWIVASELQALLTHGLDAEVAAMREAAVEVTERLGQQRLETQRALDGIDAELKDAAKDHREADVGRFLATLGDAQRRTESLLRLEQDQQIQAGAVQRSERYRYLVLRPPLVSSEPVTPHGGRLVLLALLAALLGGLASAAFGAWVQGLLLTRAQAERALPVPVLAGHVVAGRLLKRVPSHVALVVLALSLVSGLVGGLTRGSVPMMVLPWAAASVAWWVWTKPLIWPLLVLAGASCTLDDPQNRPYSNYWQSPLYPVGKLLFTNVALFTGFELALMALLVLMVVRRVRKSTLDPGHDHPPRLLRLAVLLSAATVGGLVVFGMARGGDFRQALWQFRFLLMMPVASTLFLYAVDLERDLPRLLGVVVVGSVVRSVLGIWFMYQVAIPRGIDPPHTTGHNDTMVYVTAVLAACLLMFEKPSRKHLLVLLTWLPLVAMAIRLNDRRIAYVDLGLAAVTIWLISPMNTVKRFLAQAAVVSAPIVLLYLALGWNTHGSRVFGPAEKIRSIVAPVKGSEEESSNVERDIENYNLLQTWEENPVLGQGFGHAFKEYVPSNDFGQSNFGHIGHNSVLWLWWLGGLVGFSALWFYVPVTYFLAGRALRRTRVTRERTALLLAMGVVLTYMSQAFGDMGTQSMQNVFFVSASVAVVGRLAARYRVMQVGAGRAAAGAQEERDAAGPDVAGAAA